MFSSISYYRNRNPNPNPNRNPNKIAYFLSILSQLPRNWLELPEDIWLLIFSKLYAIYIIQNVQKVCMLFRKICKNPSLYRAVNMTIPWDFQKLSLRFKATNLIKHVVDRSCGGLIDIYLESGCDEPTLNYIIERSKNLKHLRLGPHSGITGMGLIDVVKRLPELEELEFILCYYSEDIIELIGHICHSLKSFSLNFVGQKDLEGTYNEEALAIAKSMPNLRRLQLIGNPLNNDGLKAILDGCPHLESLDLRCCYYVDLTGKLGDRCGNIKHLRLPNDSTKDCPHPALMDPDTDSDDTDSDDTDSDGFHHNNSDCVYGDDSGNEYHETLCDDID